MTPGLVHRVAGQLAADRCPNAAAGAVGADHVLGPDRRGLPGLLALLQVRHGGGHRVLRSAAGVDPDVGGVQAVERSQPAGRALHVVEEVGQHPRLVDDHVRHLRETLFDVVDASGARDPGPILGVRAPERDFVDPVALVDQPVREAERLEHLHRAAGDPVGLSHLQRTVLPVDDRGPDVREVGQLRGQDEPGRTASDDQDVDVLGQDVRAVDDGRVRVLDERITGLVTVEIELHRELSVVRRWLSVTLNVCPDLR